MSSTSSESTSSASPTSRSTSIFRDIETCRLGPLTTPRIWTGLWQLSSNAWGSASVSKIRQGMARHVDLGYSTFADHYGSSELIFGQYRNSLPAPDAVICATKWCVFKPINISRAGVLAAVQERLERTGANRLDILQFHWNDYTDKGYLTALQILQEMKGEGLISAIGLVNFDAIRTDEICTQLGHGAIVSNQVQFSIIDTRPLHGMADVCEKHDIKLLTYGTLCGGFLADQWLHQPEPDLYAGHLTPSQRKYLDMILKAWGTWELFQTLLLVLRAIGDRHGGLSISNIATRWVLDHSFVGAVIIGARLGISEHPDENKKVFGFSLTEEDRTGIEAVLSQSNGREMIITIGDCGSEYR